MSLVAAFGLGVAGFLFRIVMKIAGARRRRIMVDRSESNWLDYRNEHELRDDEQPESAHQREGLIEELIDRNEHVLRDDAQHSTSIDARVKLIDDLQASVIPTASDDTPHHSFRNGDELQENPKHRGREADVADEISRREDTLEQLKRDLDRLLRSPRVA